MAEREVLRMGHPALRRVSEGVDELGTDELRDLVTDLWDTMKASGGVGLAAPQIGISKRVVVFGIDQHPNPDIAPIPYTVLINPVITPLNGRIERDWEACLSVPGLSGLVPRYTHIRYTGVDVDGNPIEREVEGYHARVVQ